jgi:tRNA(Ile)-lysidine synthase
MPFSAQTPLVALRALGPVARVWVAYSGGSDSAVLLHVLARQREALGAPLAAVHVDHALHPDSGAWTAHCRATCAALGVPLEVLAVDPLPRRAALGVEAAAREARYAALAGLLRPGDCLLTAHHADDQAETVLLQLLRGAGPAGLAAMPRVAPLGAGRLVRPLLDVARAELRAYAQANAVACVEDPSNRDPALARAYLRAAVMPRLEARWPGLRGTLARAARHAADAAAIIAERAAEDLSALTVLAPWRMPVPGLLALSLARRRAVLRHWCAVRGVPPPDTARLDALLGQLAAARAGRAVEVAWPGGAWRRYGEVLFLSPVLPPHDPSARLRWDGRRPLTLPAGLGTMALVPGGALRQDALAEGIEVGFRAAGLRCAPAGRRGRRDLKHLFQEAGVPPWLRDRVPLLLVGGHLAAIADRWVCTPFAASGATAGLELIWHRPDHLDVWTRGARRPGAR